MNRVDSILVVIYIAGTVFFWRKSSFSEPRKTLFSLSILPLIFAAMVVNIWLVDSCFPALMDLLSEARLHDARAASQGIHLRATEAHEPAVGVLIATPLAGIMAFCWYLFFLAWEKRASTAVVVNKQSVASARKYGVNVTATDESGELDDDEAEIIELSGFDPYGEPELRRMKNGELWLRFNFMPPTWVPEEERDDFGRCRQFDQKLSRAVNSPVLWDDREVFLIEKPHPDTVEQVRKFLAEFRRENDTALRAAFYDDNSRGNIEIFPIENFAFFSEEIAQLSKFSKEHRAPDGIGWTDMYARKEREPVPLASLSLDIAEVGAALSFHLEPFERIQCVGELGTIEEVTDTRAFGFDSNCVVYLVEGKPSIVTDIWLDLNGPELSKQTALLAALKDLKRLGSFLLVDWGWECLFRVDDEAGLAKYLAARERHWQQQNSDGDK